MPQLLRCQLGCSSGAMSPDMGRCWHTKFALQPAQAAGSASLCMLWFKHVT